MPQVKSTFCIIIRQAIAESEGEMQVLEKYHQGDFYFSFSKWRKMEVQTARHQQLQMVPCNLQFISEYTVDQVCFLDGTLEIGPGLFYLRKSDLLRNTEQSQM